MQIKIDPNHVTGRDLIAIESGKVEPVLAFIAKFAVDDNDEPLDRDAAYEMILDLSLPEINLYAERIMVELGSAAIPPQTARASKNGAKVRAARRSG